MMFLITFERMQKRPMHVEPCPCCLPQVAHNSILAMGMLGCGTNNARVAAMLRNLAVYYHKDEHNLFMTRIAQGLLHMGKGTMTISPYHTDRSLVCTRPPSNLSNCLKHMHYTYM